MNAPEDAGSPTPESRPWGYCIALNASLFLLAAAAGVGAAIQSGTAQWVDIGVAVAPPLAVFAMMQLLVTLVPGLWLAHGTFIHAFTFPVLHGVLLTASASLLKTTPLMLMTTNDVTRTDLVWMNGRMIVLVTVLQVLSTSLFLAAWRHRGR